MVITGPPWKALAVYSRSPLPAVTNSVTSLKSNGRTCVASWISSEMSKIPSVSTGSTVVRPSVVVYPWKPM